ncbi:ATP synthase subunit s-like protein [Papilio xuthus]|uniref:ATP synthase subunit s-like protein n=1 Tax=Papilio xuthus TaxID=66420 RepID=A0A194PLQ7_PAPXU|nr:ATP synthase subunit s-like protein [Papilio xuthus]
MALSLQPKKLLRYTLMKTRSYCDNKSSYQRNEEGIPPRTVHGKPYPEWRKPWIQRDGEWTSKLSLFIEKKPSMNILHAMNNIPNLTIGKLKNWWADMKEIQEIQNQIYLPERIASLGANLAAIHFFTHRNSAVRLKGSTPWIVGDIATLNLPNRYVDGYFVEAVDCTNFHHNGIRYEGLKNLSGLNYLKWLSLNNNKHIDVWCLDRIAGQNGRSLEFLDITGHQLSLGSIIALSRMSALKFLIISDPGDNVQVQTALSMLEEEKPGLVIKIAD